MEEKKITWVTPDCFVDCDIDIIPKLSQYFKIHWIVLLGKNSRFKENDFQTQDLKKENILITFLYSKYRNRYPQNLLFFHKIKRIIIQDNPDIIYFNVIPSTPYILPLYFWLPKEKTIVTAHDGRVTASMAFSSLIKYGFHKAFNSVKHVNMFSNYQAGFFNENFPGKDVNVIPLALKDFGKPTLSKRTDCISFLYFGTIHFEKNLELLLEAANQLYEDGISGFKVSVNGVWRVKWKPEDKIRHPEIFELNIGSVPNDDIPNIFAFNHYAVYPYKNMSQSGAIKCAFNYHTPVIVSDLQGFTDEVSEGVDGFSFKSEDVDDLKRIMLHCIQMSQQDYERLVQNMKYDIEARYSIDTITGKYIQMFNKILAQ